jgi:hypothetical protein
MRRGVPAQGQGQGRRRRGERRTLKVDAISFGASNEEAGHRPASSTQEAPSEHNDAPSHRSAFAARPCTHKSECPGQALLMSAMPLIAARSGHRRRSEMGSKPAILETSKSCPLCQRPQTFGGHSRTSEKFQNATSHNLRWESRGRIAMYVGSRSGRPFYAAVVRRRVAAQWAVAPAHRHGRRLLRLRAGGPYALNCLCYDVSGTHLGRRRPNGPPNFVGRSSVLC